MAVDFPGGVPFEAAHGLSFALAFGSALGDIVLGPLARRHSDHDDLIKGMVGVAITASTEPVAGRLA
ncbi:hypothetical protein [Arthrobacter sp. StoSoilB13]|uniref:hypothetical protein n=1 Tax=Arthrobacter sp. StoSoilB13 TaxID=2830993 RepID=UPI0021E114ED|nr:hypothetical protein [Arthrobacter sp. StoSoilB13]